MKKTIIGVVLAFLLLMQPTFASSCRRRHKQDDSSKQSCPQPEMPAQSYRADHETKADGINAIYNHQAGVNTRGWDLFFNTSFIYWMAQQGGMTLMIPFPTGFNAGQLQNGAIVNQDVEFKPGFKIEAGFKSDSFDDWGGKIEYTRLHASSVTSGTAPNIANGGIFLSYYLFFQSAIFIHDFNSIWDVDLDVINFGLYRTYYVGRRLTLKPFFGGQWGFLDQSLNIAATVRSNVNPNPAQLRNSSDSWFIGPRVALDTSWILGYGVRLVGNAGAAMTFQRFKVRHSESETSNLGNPGISTNMTESFLQPNFDLHTGLGWGTYAWNKRVYIDFQATYDFTIYWAQNWVRTLAGMTASATESQPGNLTYQGLALKGQLNF